MKKTLALLALLLACSLASGQGTKVVVLRDSSAGGVHYLVPVAGYSFGPVIPGGSSGQYDWFTRNARTNESGMVSPSNATDSVRFQYVRIDSNYKVNYPFVVEAFEANTGAWSLTKNRTANLYGETRDNVVYRWGYNMHAGGSNLVSGEPAIGYETETFYRNSATDSVMEHHLAIYGADGSGFRPFSLLYFRNLSGANKDYIQFSFSGNRIDFKDSVDGSAFFRIMPFTRGVHIDDGTLVLQNTTVSNTVLVTLNTLGQTVSGIDTAGNISAKSFGGVTMANAAITSVKNIMMQSGYVYGSLTELNLRSAANYGGGMGSAANDLTFDDFGQFAITAKGPTRRAFTLNAKAGQSVDVFQVRNSVGTVWFGVGPQALTAKAGADSNGVVQGSQFRLSSLNTAPAGPAASGTLGEIRVTTDSFFVCVATNTWKAQALNAY